LSRLSGSNSQEFFTAEMAENAEKMFNRHDAKAPRKYDEVF
jgi:hypothetical protein